VLHLPVRAIRRPARRAQPIYLGVTLLGFTVLYLQRVTFDRMAFTARRSKDRNLGRAFALHRGVRRRRFAKVEQSLLQGCALLARELPAPSLGAHLRKHGQETFRSGGGSRSTIRWGPQSCSPVWSR